MASGSHITHGSTQFVPLGWKFQSIVTSNAVLALSFTNVLWVATPQVQARVMSMCKAGAVGALARFAASKSERIRNAVALARDTCTTCHVPCVL